MNSFRFIERGIRAEIARQEQDPRRRRSGRPGDAPLRPGLRRDHLAALQGGGARLSLLPRARPAARGDRRGDARDARAGDDRAAGRSRRALRAGAWAERGQRPAARLPSRARRLLRGGARRRRASPPAPAQTLANWISGRARRDGSADGEDPAASRVQPRALGGARRPRRGEAGQRRRRAPGARQAASPRAATIRRRSSRPRGSRRWTARRSWPRSSRRALEANADAAERVREGNAKAIGPIVGYVMRETKGRADGAEVTRLVHEQLGI